MIQPMPKRVYLAWLQERNQNNREFVEATFVPLDPARRSVRPASGEWSVDQCFSHLDLAHEFLVPKFITALDIPEPPDSDGIFRPSFFAKYLLEKVADPSEKSHSTRRNNPTLNHKAEPLTNWLEKQARLEAILAQAYSANLQTKRWFLKWLLIKYTLGDFLNHIVSHDEVHIDQARRALAAVEHSAAVPQPVG